MHICTIYTIVQLYTSEHHTYTQTCRMPYRYALE